MAVNLGDKVKDSITGIMGIVVARCEWLHGCIRCTIQPIKLQNGKIADTITFDEPQLIVIETTGKKKPPIGGGGRDDRQSLSKNIQ